MSHIAVRTCFVLKILEAYLTFCLE